MLISFWLCLFIIKLYSRNDIFSIDTRYDLTIYSRIISLCSAIWRENEEYLQNNT